MRATEPGAATIVGSTVRPRRDDGPAFAPMLAVARAAGWPAHYATDFTEHDRNAVRICRGPFAWYLYPMGTYIVRPRKPGERTRRAQVPEVQASLEGGAWHWWDGVALQPVSADRAEELLRQEECAHSSLDVFSGCCGHCGKPLGSDTEEP